MPCPWARRQPAETGGGGERRPSDPTATTLAGLFRRGRTMGGGIGLPLGAVAEADRAEGAVGGTAAMVDGTVGNEDGIVDPG